MNIRQPLVALLLAAALLAACNGGPNGTKKTPLKVGAQQLAGESVVGLLEGPAGLVASGGGNFISGNGASLIAQGGGNVIGNDGHSIKARKLLAVQEQPLAGIRVVLADAAGQLLPGVAPVETDASGHYTLKNVPPGTYLVLAATGFSESESAPLLTVVNVTAAGATANVDMATTFVTVALTDGNGAGLKDLDPGAFRRAADATEAKLATGDVPSLADRALMLAKMEELAKTVKELTDALAAMKREVSDLAERVKQLEQERANGGGGTKTSGGVSKPFAWPGEIRQLAGGPEAGFVDGAGKDARFGEPMGPCLDRNGRLLLADRSNHAIRAIAKDGSVTTLAGVNPAKAGFMDGEVPLLNGPRAILPERGNPKHAFLIADPGNNVLRGLELGASGPLPLTAAIGTPGTPGDADHSAASTGLLRAPVALIQSADDTLFIADLEAKKLRFQRDAKLQTAALEPAGLTAPAALAADTGGRVYLADGERVLALTPVDQPATRFTVKELGRFKEPAGLAIAPNGSLLVAEAGAHRIAVLDPDTGKLTHTMGGEAPGGDVKHIAADFGEVNGLAVAPDGSIYATDRSLHRVWELVAP